MEDVTFNVIEVDGVLADIRPIFNALATAVLDKPVMVPELGPPHTLLRMAQAAGLSSEDLAAVRRTVYEIKDFWVSVPPVPPEATAIPLPAPNHMGSIFHVSRPQTRGRPVLLQTIEWLTKQGYKNPIVWVEED